MADRSTSTPSVPSHRQSMRQGHAGGAFEGVAIRYTRHEERAQAFLRVLQSQKPDLVLTQLMWSDVALWLARQTEVMPMLRVCNILFNLNTALGAAPAPGYVSKGSSLVEKHKYPGGWITAIGCWTPGRYAQAAICANHLAEAHTSAQTKGRCLLPILRELTGE